MKSVGEVMAIGRTFEEAIQKGLRMIGQGMHGFVENKELVIPDIDKALREPTDKRIFVISKAFRAGYTVDQVHELTKIDRWFLEKLMNIMQTSKELHAWGANHKQLTDLPDTLLYKAKRQGFSDFQVARAIGMEGEMEDAIVTMRQHRKQRGILPVVKQIDTLAAEYPAQTNYLYLTYSGTENDVHYLGDRKSIVVLGSGAYRIGSSVEFDWCGVQALNTIRKEGYRSVMINYNPETVSTDYDMCDRLYFDELTFERVMDILDLENPHGVIVSTGGQIPNNLAMRLDAQQVPILGTSAKSIDNAEDRDKFSAMLDRIGVDQPEWSALTSMEDINAFVEKVGFPVLVRPSYVLSGAAMNVGQCQPETSRGGQPVYRTCQGGGDGCRGKGWRNHRLCHQRTYRVCRSTLRRRHHSVPASEAVCRDRSPHQAHQSGDSPRVEDIGAVQHTIPGKRQRHQGHRV